MYFKDITLKATTHIKIRKGNPQTKCGFHLQFADSTYNLQTPLTVADSATAQFNDTKVSSFDCGVHKLFGFRKISCGFRKFAYFSSNFERCKDLGFFCGIQNSIEDQRKVAIMRIPRQI